MIHTETPNKVEKETAQETEKEMMIRIIRASTDERIKLIDSIPEQLFSEISQVTEADVYLRTVDSLTDMKNQLRRFVRVFGNYQLRDYSEFFGQFTIAHIFNDFTTLSYISRKGSKEALAELSDGKCSFENKTTTKEVVVCLQERKVFA